MFSITSARRFGLAAIMTLALAVFATPASAQLQPWQDFEASDSVWIVTHVDLDPGTFGIYLEGLKSTWIAANEVAKELGQIKDYAIYANQFGGADEFDLLLVVEMESTDDIAPNRERYEEFLEAYGQANIDEANETVLELYNKIRRIQGNYLLRKIDVK
ncbi:MAG: hypothetical protein QNJ11_11695 [Woeseiaceae bacterium]|nr:hypothetical protein [Woeseiaceae bacterium]